MANLDDLDDDFILCNICNNEYDEEHRSPKLLPCLHTLCNDCTLNSVQGTVIRCAICTEEHQMSNDLHFLKDSTMRNMMDMIRIQRKSSSIMCSDCPDNNNGETFCKDCYVFLCKECTSAHKRTQVTRKHSVLSIDELKTSGIASFTRKEMCSLPGHEDQPFSFYCENEECQKPVCTQCVVSDHSQSNGHAIRNLNEVYEENKHLVERSVGELLTKISGVSSEAKVLEHESSDITEKDKEVKSQIDNMFDAFEEMLKQRREKLKQRVDVICQQRKAEVGKQLETLQKSKVDMENSCNYSSRMLVFTNKPEFLQLKETVLSKLNLLVNTEDEIKLSDTIELSFDAGSEKERFEDILENLGEIQTNVYGESEDDLKSITVGKNNSQPEMNGHLVLPYRGPPLNPPGKYTTNKYTSPVKTPSRLNTVSAKVEPLKLDGLLSDPPSKPSYLDMKQTNKVTKTSPTSDGNFLGRPLSLKSPVITPSKQPSSLGDFLNDLQAQTREVIREKRYQWMLDELQTESRLFLKQKRNETQDGDQRDQERQLPKTPPTTPSVLSTTSKRSPLTPTYSMSQTLDSKYKPSSPVKYGAQSPTGTMNGPRSGPGITSPGAISPGLTSPSFVQNSFHMRSPRTVTFGSPRFREILNKTESQLDASERSSASEKSPASSSTDISNDTMSSSLSSDTLKSKVSTSGLPTSGCLKTGSTLPKDMPVKAVTSPRVLTEDSYPEVKQSTTSPRKTGSDKPVVFGDISCPDFHLDTNSAHHEREVTTDGRTLRNKKTDIYGGGAIDIENSLVQYKGAIGTIPFQEAGKFYYEIDVVYNIQQPLEETWLVFEIGLCRLDDVDMHHTVERHEHARSFYVARYPENNKLTQEFWHNRDLLNFLPLSDNTAGIEMRITYGFLVDTKRKKWIVADCNNNKVLHTFEMLDFAEPLHPVLGCYNPDLCTVEMTVKTGTEITMIPQCIKPGYRSP